MDVLALLNNALSPAAPVTTRAARPAFDSDMHEALLKAYSIMQQVNIAAHQDDGMDDASAACQLVSELL